MGVIKTNQPSSRSWWILARSLIFGLSSLALFSGSQKLLDFQLSFDLVMIFSLVISLFSLVTDLIDTQINNTRLKRSTPKDDSDKIVPTPQLLELKPNQTSSQPDLSQANYWEIFDQTKFGLILFTPDGRIAYANQLAQNLVTPDYKLHLYSDDEQDINQWIENARNNKLADYQIWHKVSNSPAINDEQKFYDVITNFRKDEAIETVVILIDRSEFYVKDEEDFDFIAFATHEIRGPITVIRGYLEILESELKPKLKDDYRQIFDRLMVSANRLSTYINNILSVSKYDRKHFQVYIQEENLSDIIDSVIDDLKLRALTQNRLLNFDIKAGLPSVAADKSSIGEVIVNLVDNAIKYSHEGGIINVNALVKGEFVEIQVSDRGIGMPSNVVNNLFKKFYRSHRSRETIAGTGIGLYLSKAIIDSHGGYIGVNSEVGEGSTFNFGLPIYANVADKLKDGAGDSQVLIKQRSGGWIKNHGLYKN